MNSEICDKYPFLNIDDEIDELLNFTNFPINIMLDFEEKIGLLAQYLGLSLL
jgi:hypothetical protein